MSDSIFVGAAEVAEVLGISKALAYRMIRDWNEELKKKGYSLKEIGKLIPLFYYNSTKDIQNNQEPKVHKVLKGKNKKRASVPEESRIPVEFMEAISKIVLERMKEENSEEARYKRFDERIRNYQQSRREVAASEEKSKAKKNRRKI